MQTFMPFPCFIQSARALDYRRLGKQRVECKQILNALSGRSTGWTRHPVTLMWKGFEESLKLYCNCVIDEWVKRGYKNNMHKYPVNFDKFELPGWFGDTQFHSGHRERLKMKDPVFYGSL